MLVWPAPHEVPGQGSSAELVQQLRGLHRTRLTGLRVAVADTRAGHEYAAATMNAPVTSEPPALTRQQKVLTLAGTLLAMFLAALDQTVVATAGPDMQRSLHLPPGLYTWITTAYLVTSTVLVPVYGRLSDLFGRKVILLVGVVIFLAASALCGISQNATQLIAFRALQGVGSASLFISAFAVVADLFTPAERGRYTGLFGAVFGVSSLVGPLLGGFITDHFGWHWVFFINLPIGAVALAFIVLRMPALKPQLAERPTVDVMGAVLLAVGAVPLLIGASLGRTVLREGDVGFLWTSPPMLAMGLLVVLGLVGFVAWELRVKDPLVDLSLFKTPAVKWGVLAMFVLGAAFLTPMVFLPLFMVNVVGVTATASGLTISPLVMGIVAGNVVSGQLASRFGTYKPFMLVALVVMTFGFLVMGFTLTASSTQSEVTLKMVLLGLGLGPSIPLYTLAIQNAVDPRQMGVATSMTTFFRSMGSTVGVAVVGSLFATTLAESVSTRMVKATEGLSPQVVERFSKQQPGAEADESGALHFDAEAQKQKASDGLEGARSLALKALDGDRLAALAVQSSPLADDELKAAVADGGPKAQVRARASTTWLRVQEAAQDPGRWTALLESNELAPAVRKAALEVSPSVLKDGAGPALALQPVKALIDAEAERLGGMALQKARTKVELRLAVEKPKVLAVIDAVGLSFKEGFTDAISLVYRLAAALGVLAFLLTLKIPQLPLRGRAVPVAPTE
ncbi:MAG: MDR family MFS transporter [Myxococcales bacterium]|nr:MDR family MFS transporter [Myxococcales bacterium]